MINRTNSMPGMTGQHRTIRNSAQYRIVLCRLVLAMLCMTVIVCGAAGVVEPSSAGNGDPIFIYNGSNESNESYDKIPSMSGILAMGSKNGSTDHAASVSKGSPRPQHKNPKMVSALAELADRFETVAPADVRGFAIMHRIKVRGDGGRVQVVLVMSGETQPFDRYKNVEIEAQYKNLVQASVPISELETLAEDPAIQYIRQPNRPHPATVSDGAGVINATALQAIGINGTGVKVAVIDLGFYGFETSSEVWNVVEACSFRGDGDITGGGERHGTACAEVILDVAPNASLYLYNIDSDITFGEAVNHSIARGIDIISCSLGWVNAGPYDGTGFVCDIANNANANGIFFVNSAGNQAKRHYEGGYNDTDGDDWHEFEHGVDEVLDLGYLSTGRWITLFLSWDDWDVVDQDYDLYLVKEMETTWDIVSASENWQDGTIGQEPTEVIEYHTSTSGHYGVAIGNWSSRGDAHLELYSFNNDFLDHNVESSSLMIPADAAGVVAAGATRWTDDHLEYFSSQGPTNDGRLKPDVTAPDGVSNSVYGSFYGTSASAPHVAGAAALLLDANSSLGNNELRCCLESTAKDLDTPGKDNKTGSGRIDVYAAYSVAPCAPIPELASFVLLAVGLLMLAGYVRIGRKP